MAAQEIPLLGGRPKLLSRAEVAEGTMAVHFEKPPGFDFKPRTIKSERLNRNSAFTGSG